MRRIISTALVAVSLVAVTAVGAVAQSEPTTEQAITPAGLNADKVDGRHAVGHRASRAKRAGKLVATNKQGYLPSNIIKPAWRLILGKPAAFRDGVIGWGEVQDKPPDFADGVDDVGVAGVEVTRVSAFKAINPNGTGQVTTTCPGGTVAIGGGFVSTIWEMNIVSSGPLGSTQWFVSAKNPTGTSRNVYAHVVCMSTTPGGALEVTGKVTQARKPK